MSKISSKEIKRVGIFRALQLGDLLCSIPAIRAFKKSFPDTELYLIGLPWAGDFIKRYPHYFNGFISFPGYPGLPEQQHSIDTFVSFLQEVKQYNFDLVIQMHGNGSIINPMVSLLSAKYNAGYYEPGRYCPNQELFMPYPDDCNEVERHMKLMQFLGIESAETDLEIPFQEKDISVYTELCRSFGLEENKFVCIHPGARDPKRWWSPEYFARIGDELSAKGFKVVLTGTEKEREIVERVAGQMKNAPVDLSGKTDLGSLTVLISNSRLMVSNDTGVSHIASATKTPSVVIFLASDPARWAPMNKELHQVVLPERSNDLDYILSKTEYQLKKENNRVI